MRLIDADALESAFSSLRWGRGGTLTHWGDRDDWVLKGREFARLIKDAPTVETGTQWATWEEKVSSDRKRWQCSKCGKAFGLLSVGFKFCPECGARMGEHPMTKEGDE